MGPLGPRLLAIAFFAAAAILAGVGNSTHRSWLTALAFAAFVLGVASFFRWRRAARGRVFDREDKTRR
jgi:hypothetical protein